MEKDSNPAAGPASESPVAPAFDRDGFLQVIVSYVQDNDGGLPITLAANGMLIAGRVVGAKAYFREISKTFGQSLFGDEQSETRTKLEENMATLADLREGEPPLRAEELNFIHLRDAKFYSAAGESINVTSSVLWRGRISEITGWSYGEFSKS